MSSYGLSPNINLFASTNILAGWCPSELNKLKYTDKVKEVITIKVTK